MEYFHLKHQPSVEVITSEMEHMRVSLHPDNVSLSEEWIQTMTDAIPTDDYLSDLAQSYFMDAFQNTSELRLANTLEHLSMAIRIAPRISTPLHTALANRADALVNAKEYDAAIADYESNLAISDVQYHGETFKSIINVRLLSGDRIGSQEYLNRFVEWNRRRSDRLKTLQQNSRKSALDMKLFTEEKRQQDEDDYHNEIRKIRSRIGRMAGSKSDYSNAAVQRPYLGYTPRYPEIKAASVACSHVKLTTSKEPMILANRPIPMLETIMLETPQWAELIKPNLQCDFCRRPQNFFIPCFDCHSGSYCSVRCQEHDQSTHKFECFGMRSQVLPLLESRLLLRLVVRGLKWISGEVVQSEPARHITNASDMYSFVCKTAEESSQIDYCNMFNLEPRLNEFNQHELSDCVKTSVMLTTFAMRHSRPIQQLCKGLFAQMGPSDAELFVGALILRHAAQLKQKSINLHFELDRTAAHSSKTCASVSTKHAAKMSSPELNHKSVATLAVEVKTFLKGSFAEPPHQQESTAPPDDVVSVPTLRPNEPRTEDRDYVRDTLSKCFHYAVEVSFSQRNSHLESTRQRQALKMFMAEMFKFSQYKRDPIDSGRVPQGMRCVLASVARLRHSCDPNAVLTLVSPNLVAIKACRKIESGDEITISYGVHYKSQNSETRRDYLAERMIKCVCSPCRGIDHFVRVNSFECQTCAGVLLARNQGCHRCLSPNSSVWQLLREAERHMQLLHSNETTEANHVFDVYLAVLVVYVEALGSASYAVFSHLRRIAIWLSQKNYIQQAFDFIAEMCSSSSALHPDMRVEMYHDLLLSVELLVRLLEANSTKIREKLRLFYDIHAFATDGITTLRHTAAVRLLPKTLTATLDGYAERMECLRGTWPPLNQVDAKKSWRTTAPRTNFVRDLYAKMRSSKADKYGGISTRTLLARIFGDAEEPDANGLVEEGTDEFGTYIYYNTGTALNWCDEVELDESD